MAPMREIFHLTPETGIFITEKLMDTFSQIWSTDKMD